MSPEKIGANNTDTSEVKSTSEVLTNEEKTAQNEATDIIVNTDLGINENEENLSETNETELSFNETINSILNDPEFKGLSKEEIQAIKESLLDYDGMELSISELKDEAILLGDIEVNYSVEDEFNNRNEALALEGKPQKERLIILLKEFESSTEIPTYIDSARRALAVLNFTETDKTITKEEKALIQTKLGSADLFSPGGFETAMYAVYEDESISEETKEKLISVSGVVDVPKIDINTPSNLSKDLKNRNEARDKQFTKLKKQEKTLTKEKEKLEAIPESERTEEQQEELEQLEKQLQTVQKQKEYFDKENRGTVTRRTMPMGGTAELSKSSLFFPAKTIMELNGKRIPLLGSATKQNQAIDCLYSADRLQNGNGKRTPLYLGDFIYGKIENGKPIAPAQLDISKTVRQYMSIGDNNEIITNQELKETEKVFQAFRNPNSTRNKDGARQGLVELGLLNKGEKKLSLSNVHKLGEMIQFIRNTPTLPPQYDNMHDYLKAKFGKKEDGEQEN